MIFMKEYKCSKSEQGHKRIGDIIVIIIQD